MIKLHFATTGQSIEIDPSQIGRMCRTQSHGIDYTEIQVGDTTYYVRELPSEISALWHRATDSPPAYADVEGEILRALRAAVKHRDLGAVAALSEALTRLTNAESVGRCD